MEKSVQLRKILMLLLCFVVSCSLFLGVASYVLARGKYGKDHLTNNINHSGDFYCRLQAQVNLYAIYGDEFINSFN